jgi:hypothetical protein
MSVNEMQILEFKKIISAKDELIKELEEKLQMETMVKKSEVMVNKELSDIIEKIELHNESLIEINEVILSMILCSSHIYHNSNFSKESEL